MIKEGIILTFKTRYGKAQIRFEIVKDLGFDRYVLYNEGRIFIGNITGKDEWFIGNPIDTTKYSTLDPNNRFVVVKKEEIL